MDKRHPQRVEDYTTANLILIFVNMLWIFGVIWANFGIVPIILLGWAMNQMITKLEHMKLAREYRPANRSHSGNHLRRG